MLDQGNRGSLSDREELRPPQSGGWLNSLCRSVDPISGSQSEVIKVGSWVWSEGPRTNWNCGGKVKPRALPSLLSTTQGTCRVAGTVYHRAELALVRMQRTSERKCPGSCSSALLTLHISLAEPRSRNFQGRESGKPVPALLGSESKLYARHWWKMRVFPIFGVCKWCCNEEFCTCIFVRLCKHS